MTSIELVGKLGDNVSHTHHETPVSKNTRSTSRKISEILATGPYTVNYINKGENLAYEDDMLLLFGKVADKRRGIIYKGEMEIKILGSKKLELEKGLEEDKEIGMFDKIHHIKANPETIISLFIEGVIKPENIKGALVTDGTIIISNVSLEVGGEKKAFTFMCRNDFAFTFATVDKKGNLIISSKNTKTWN